MKHDNARLCVFLHIRLIPRRGLIVNIAETDVKYSDNMVYSIIKKARARAIKKARECAILKARARVAGDKPERVEISDGR